MRPMTSLPGSAADIALHLRELLPSSDDLRPVRTSWRGDLIAGVTVGVVALPLALAFGVSSGMGAAAGIVTAIVAGLVAAVFGGSHVQVSGPTGAMAVILAPIVAEHGPKAVVAVSVMAGILLVAAGVLRLGRIVVYIPWPVIEGFTAGIAIIIALQQVPLALDAGDSHGERPLTAAVDAVVGADYSRAWVTLVLALGVIAVVEGLRRVNGSLPGAIIAVVAATIVAEAAGLDVGRIGELPSSLPAPHVPLLPMSTLSTLVAPALAVAALAAIESLLSARVAAGMAPTGRVLPDREIVGQGLASIASGFFGGMPATGAIARTAVNVRAGGRSRLASITHSALLMLVIAVGATLASRIPLAALAGVLLATTLRMVDPGEVMRLLRVSRGAALTFVVTVVCTVLLDLITAVEIGVLLAAFFALRALAGTSRVRREPLPGTPQPGDEHIALMRLEGSLFFGAADRIMDDLADLDAWVVIVRLSNVNLMDATGARRLAELVALLEARRIRVIVKGLRPEHAAVATRTGMVDSLHTPGHLMDDLDEAVQRSRNHVARRLAAAETAARE